MCHWWSIFWAHLFHQCIVHKYRSFHRYFHPVNFKSTVNLGLDSFWPDKHSDKLALLLPTLCDYWKTEPYKTEDNCNKLQRIQDSLMSCISESVIFDRKHPQIQGFHDRRSFYSASSPYCCSDTSRKYHKPTRIRQKNFLHIGLSKPNIHPFEHSLCLKLDLLLVDIQPCNMPSTTRSSWKWLECWDTALRRLSAEKRGMDQCSWDQTVSAVLEYMNWTSFHSSIARIWCILADRLDLQLGILLDIDFRCTHQLPAQWWQERFLWTECYLHSSCSHWNFGERSKDQVGIKTDWHICSRGIRWWHPVWRIADCIATRNQWREQWTNRWCMRYNFVQICRLLKVGMSWWQDCFECRPSWNVDSESEVQFVDRSGNCSTRSFGKKCSLTVDYTALYNRPTQGDKGHYLIELTVFGYRSHMVIWWGHNNNYWMW